MSAANASPASKTRLNEHPLSSSVQTRGFETGDPYFPHLREPKAPRYVDDFALHFVTSLITADFRQPRSEGSRNAKFCSTLAEQMLSRMASRSGAPLVSMSFAAACLCPNSRLELCDATSVRRTRECAFIRPFDFGTLLGSLIKEEKA